MAKKVGWKRSDWDTPTRCGCCEAIIREGIINVNDWQDPPQNALCGACYTYIREQSA